MSSAPLIAQRSLLLAAALIAWAPAAQADPCVPDVDGVCVLEAALDTAPPETAAASRARHSTVTVGSDPDQWVELDDGRWIELPSRTEDGSWFVLPAGETLTVRLSAEDQEDIAWREPDRVRLEIRSPGWGELLDSVVIADGSRDPATGELIYADAELTLPEHAYGELSVTVITEKDGRDDYPGTLRGLKFLAASQPGGTVDFGGDWTHGAQGLQAGEGVELRYDPARMDALLGQPAREITAFVSFDGGAPMERPVLVSAEGERSVVVPPTAVPFGVHEVEIWFRGTAADGSEAWDSNYGHNFGFEVDVARPDASPDWRKAIHASSFPNMADDDFQALSSYDKRYNCYAWAMGIRDQFIWDIGTRTEPYDAAFEALGYTPIDTLDLAYDPDVERVALYGHPTHPGAQDSAYDWSVTHAALQRPQDEGWWTSKIGDMPLIRHRDADDVGGPAYGEVFRVYERPARRE